MQSDYYIADNHSQKYDDSCDDEVLVNPPMKGNLLAIYIAE